MAHPPRPPPPSSELLAQLQPLCASLAAHNQLSTRPHVTLAFTQSLDGALRDEHGKRVRTRDGESGQLQHVLRALHDAILIGIDTLLHDAPQLHVRLVDGADPRPVILDSALRFPVAQHGALLDRRVLVVCTREGLGLPVDSEVGGDDTDGEVDEDKLVRLAALQSVGCDVLICRARADGAVDLLDALARLREHGVGSVLVEAGAKVAGSFLTRRAQVLDFVVVTMCPVFVGGGSPSVNDVFLRGGPAWLAETATLCVGSDMVVLGSFKASKTPEVSKTELQ